VDWKQNSPTDKYCSKGPAHPLDFRPSKNGSEVHDLLQRHADYSVLSIGRLAGMLMN